MNKLILAAALAASLTGCEAGAKVTGMASDGESFTGIANATGYWDASGTLNLVSNRGLTCVGTYAYTGLGPNGRASFTCNNGETGEVRLDGNTSTGEGTIGNRRITVRWGSVRT